MNVVNDGVEQLVVGCPSQIRERRQVAGEEVTAFIRRINASSRRRSAALVNREPPTGAGSVCQLRHDDRPITCHVYTQDSRGVQSLCRRTDNGVDVFDNRQVFGECDADDVGGRDTGSLRQRSPRPSTEQAEPWLSANMTSAYLFGLVLRLLTHAGASTLLNPACRLLVLSAGMIMYVAWSIPFLLLATSLSI